METLSNYPLAGKTALVTGVSRRRGIGFSICKRLAADGANLVFSHYSPHDAAQPWGVDDIAQVRAELQAALRPGASLADLGVGLEAPQAPAALWQFAKETAGSVEILVCNQARSGGDGSVLDVSPQMLDGHFAVNARATVMLTSLFAKDFAGVAGVPGMAPGQRLQRTGLPEEYSTGRVIWITSGQARPMPGEVAYALSKAALAGLTPTVAAELLPLGILLNTVNPGPVNTGYLDPVHSDRPAEVLEQVAAAMPLGRFGQPDDTARLVSWLVSEESRWVVGQVLNSDGGFALQ